MADGVRPQVPAVAVHGLAKTYFTFRKAEGLLGSIRSLVARERIAKEAVKGIDFEVGRGELVGFLGPNGAGKTTTMKMLTGILHPTSGSAEVLGHVPWRREKELLKRIALVMGQKAQLWWDLPAADSFLLNRDIYEVAEHDYRRRLGELTELFELADLLHVPVRNLSLGERMKCELVACLLHDPEILFLDEPTIGLDIVSQRRLRSFLKSYNQVHGLTIVLTSHYMQDIRELCDRVVVVNHGEIAFDGGLAALMDLHADLKVVRLTWASEIRDPQVIQRLRPVLAGFGDVRELDPWAAAVELTGSVSAAEVAAAVRLRAMVEIDSAELQPADIEAVMERIFTAKATLPRGEGAPWH